MKEADGLGTEERYNTLVNAGNLPLAMAAKNGIWDTDATTTTPLAPGPLATKAATNGNTTAAVPARKSDFDNLANKFEALSLSLLAQQSGRIQPNMPMPAVLMYPLNQFAGLGPVNRLVGVASQQVYGYTGGQGQDNRGYPLNPQWNGGGGRDNFPQGRSQAPNCFYCVKEGHMRRACLKLREDTAKGLVHEGADYKLYHGPPGPNARYVNTRGH